MTSTGRIILVLLWFTGSGLALGQDSITPGRRPYSSAGFNVSSVSGLGLSYRHHFDGPSLLQLTGGLISSESGTNSALGLEYQYELSKKETFRYYIAAGGGVYTASSSSTALGIGIGLELPILGDVIYESVTGGLAIFYPVSYTGDARAIVSFGGSLYFYYNF
jgi:hypothetical protein